MDNFELQRIFEQDKNRILGKIERAKEQWQVNWEKVQGDLAAEAQLIWFNLQIKIMEIEALEELKQMEEKIKGTIEEK